MTTDASAPAPRRRRAPESGGHRRKAKPEPSGGRGNRRRRKAKKSRGKRIAKWTSISLALILIAGAGGGYFYYKHLNDQLAENSGDLTLGNKPMGKSKANAAGQTPLNILLLGSDSRNSAKDVKLGGAADTAGSERADVEMLLHVSADRSNASVLSIPRDTVVQIPACKDPKSGKHYPPSRDTINSSLQYGGPGCTVATWYDLTGIPIDHYMMVDFSGVVDMADAIGGVPVCVKANVHDPKSHLRMTKGTHKIKGVQALEWLRTRHGFEDGSDVGRTHGQHLYMNALARQMQSDSTMGSPSKLMSLAETATEKVKVDKNIDDIKKLYSLATMLKKVNLKRLTMLTMPYAPDPQAPTAHVIPNAESRALFSMLRSDVALDKNGKPAGKDGGKKGGDPSAGSSTGPSAKAQEKSAIPVTVRNAGLHTGRASELTTALRGDGFSRAASGGNAPAPSNDSSTAVRYPKDDDQAKADASAVAQALHIPATGVKGTDQVQGVTLDVGGDWAQGSDYRKALPKAGSVPDSANAQHADDSKACMDVNVKGGYTF